MDTFLELGYKTHVEVKVKYEPTLHQQVVNYYVRQCFSVEEAIKLAEKRILAAHERFAKKYPNGVEL